MKSDKENGHEIGLKIRHEIGHQIGHQIGQEIGRKNGQDFFRSVFPAIGVWNRLRYIIYSTLRLRGAQ